MSRRGIPVPLVGGLFGRVVGGLVGGVVGSAFQPGLRRFRFNSLAALAAFASGVVEGGNRGRWAITGGGSTETGNTGPGANSAGPYAATDASSGTLVELADNSTLEITAAWPAASGRVLTFRCAVAGAFNDAGEGLAVQGMEAAGAWEDIALIRGWPFGDGYEAGDEVNDYAGEAVSFVQNGGWIDTEAAIEDRFDKVRLRLVASGGTRNLHDFAFGARSFAARYDGAP